MPARRKRGSGASPAAKGPLYRSIAQELRDRLHRGCAAEGARLPALRKLAQQYQVSTVTVRQALRALEEQGYVQCVAGVGTFVCGNARDARAGHPITIAYAAVEISDGFTIEVAQGIEDACRRRDWGLEILNAQGCPIRENRNLAMLTRSRVDGAIVLPTCDYESYETMFRLKLADFPFVLVDRSIPGLRVNLVESDHEKGARLATECLIQHGYDRVMMVTGPPQTSSVAARIRGYERALREHGVEQPPGSLVWIRPERSDPDGPPPPRWLPAYKAARPALEAAQRPLGVFASNAYAAWGVHKACRDLGLAIPDDVALACFDHSEIVQALHSPIIAVAQRTFEIGEAAVDLLERRLCADPSAEPEHILIDVDLVAPASIMPAMPAETPA